MSKQPSQIILLSELSSAVSNKLTEQKAQQDLKTARIQILQERQRELIQKLQAKLGK